jgi:uncharacterized membrane protein YphA (DoxX/SURF4 family)
MTRERFATLILRVGVAFAFLFPPIDAFLDPYSWTGYFPSFMHGVVPDLVLLHVFGALEICLALWILSGWRMFLPSLMAALMLLAIVAFNMPQLQVLFRDLSIAAAAVALAVVSYPNEFVRSSARI